MSSARACRWLAIQPLAIALELRCDRGPVIYADDIQAVIVAFSPQRDAYSPTIRVHDLLHELLQIYVFPRDKDGCPCLRRSNQYALKPGDVVVPVSRPHVFPEAHGSGLDRRQRPVVVRQARRVRYLDVGIRRVEVLRLPELPEQHGRERDRTVQPLTRELAVSG